MNKHQKYSFKKYDAMIVQRFEKERSRIKALLSYARVEHIGSTAVPGLGGKGILDIMIFVPKARLPSAKNALSKRYEHRPRASTPERIFFRKKFVMNKKQNRIHLHLIHTRQELEKVISFRDYLRTHPQAVKQYAAIKQRAAKLANGDMKTYKEIKNPFIERVLKNCK